ncbi:uncharacterized protein LOC129599254 [Paramacrobiotus metropolitanus]|uniref:uncharacterized protein LOC129599254 n=1 Tax=Paramacrobiotus metropolitanus TaxID=2943436 RepID=UPI0024464BD5|nr:uncharacterized protein LOC129599254 [Paramacrobiotus metropolitanus]
MESKGASQADPLEIETFGSSCQYEYLPYDFIGRGAFGVVYNAKVSERGNYTGSDMVAVKTVHLDARHDIVSNPGTWTKTVTRLKRLPELAHENLVVCHQVRIIKSAGGATVEIMMERCHSDLTVFLKKAKENITPYGIRKDVYIGRYCKEITAGLSFLHQQKIIHGDLKPANVLVKDLPNGNKMLLVGDLDDLVPMQESVTCSGDISHLRGTVRYMSPEMLKKFCLFGAETPGRMTDIWSLGCIMLEIAECFSSSKTDEKLLQKDGNPINLSNNISNLRFAEFIMNGYVPFVSDEIPGKLAACIRLCLQESPSSRISAETLLQEFSVSNVIEFDNGTPVQRADVAIVLMNWSAQPGTVKAIKFDPATSRIRALEIPIPVGMQLIFPQLTLPNREIVFQAGHGDSEDKLFNIWKVSTGTWRSFWAKKVAEYAASSPCCSPVVTRDTIYYFQNNNSDDYHLVARDLRRGHIKFIRPVEGWNVDAIAEFEKKIVYAHHNGNAEFSELDLYDPMENSWTSLPQLSQQRIGFSMAVVGGHVYILGGTLKQAATASCVRLNISTSTWVDIHSLQKPRHRHSACVVNERIYVCGGKNAAGEVEYSMEVYDTTRDGPWSTVELATRDENLLRSTILDVEDSMIGISIAR